MTYLDDIQFHQCSTVQKCNINFRTDFYENQVNKFAGKGKVQIADQYDRFLDYAPTNNSY